MTLLRAQRDLPRALRNLHLRQTFGQTASRGGNMLLYDPQTASTLDANIWGTSAIGTGAISRLANTGVAGMNVRRLDCPAAGDAFVIESVTPVDINSPAVATAAPSSARTMYKKMVLEWIAQLGTIANIDNATFMMGFGAGGIAVGSQQRGQDDIAAFILVADALTCLTDNASTETTTTVASPPTLTEINKYRIEVDIVGPAVRFYVNDALVATHTTNLPSTTHNPATFWIQAEAGTGATLLYLGPVRCWQEDY